MKEVIYLKPSKDGRVHIRNKRIKEVIVDATETVVFLPSGKALIVPGDLEIVFDSKTVKVETFNM